ncbi:hypothetical protein HR45_01785 [Shewanella mangrovi]|uniref:Uncharacterized protein n=1 Tax=Shewanella mangrovi TaxID=1515746 RepID=A0A094JM75_9GAMM|nr:hypothetical protein [Shewanella mangrovi]KFZ39154.1 hypothetical protein HR45_01785 [Shewanella mangrovi]
MNRAWVWLVLVLAVLLAVVRVYYARSNHSEQLLLNCSSELYDHDKKDSQQYYLLMDLQADNHNVLLNYRYFTVDGTPVGSIKMHGDLKRNPAGSSYDLTIHDKEEQLLEKTKPAHMDYLSYISGLNLTNKSIHPMTLEMLDTDEQQHYAIVRFQPGNAVYGCRLQH